MQSNVFPFEPSDVRASAQTEPLESSVREVRARIATLDDERRRLFSRLNDLRGLSSNLHRRRARQVEPSLSRPIVFFSIEVADASSQPQRPQVA